jgi:hypothetical protein
MTRSSVAFVPPLAVGRALFRLSVGPFFVFYVRKKGCGRRVKALTPAGFTGQERV